MQVCWSLFPFDKSISTHLSMYSEVHEHVPKLPGSDLDVPRTLWNLGFDSISLCFQEWMIRFLLNYSSNNWIFQSSSIATNNVWNSGYYAESCKYWFILRMFLDFPLLQSRMFTQGIFSLEAGQILLKSNLFSLGRAEGEEIYLSV